MTDVRVHNRQINYKKMLSIVKTFLLTNHKILNIIPTRTSRSYGFGDADNRRFSLISICVHLRKFAS